MFSTKKTVTIVALALAGALSVGAVASAQAQSGAASHSDDPTPVTSVTPTPFADDSGLHGDGPVNDHMGTVETPTKTPAPTPSTGMPTDADHPLGDDSKALGEAEHADGEEVGEDAGDTKDVSDAGMPDDAAGHNVVDNHGANNDAPSGENAGHDSADSSQHSD